MELFDTLAAFGLTTKVLQFIIIGAIAIFLVGMYWRFIVIGAGILFCAYVFASPSKTPVSLDEPTKVIEKVKPEDKAPEEFLTDCQLYNETTRTQCELIWKEQS
jgi:hypothetical protein